ncbi:hypothetical protein [Streptomyces sp. NPDC015125]|uniref:hypothetical protein n=1 Tax=Streptomyces sp. NPDC015125 TaxID=3364938 RepID=UPI0036FC9B70
MLFFYRLIALAAGSLQPLLTRGRPDQRWTAAGTSVVVAGGFAALVSAPALSVPACTLLGLVGGECLVLALTFQSERAGSSGEAAAPAAMAQSIGYLVAAAGPLLLGALHDITSSWTLPLIALIVLSCAMAGTRYGAARTTKCTTSTRRSPTSFARAGATCPARVRSSTTAPCLPLPSPAFPCPKSEDSSRRTGL